MIFHSKFLGEGDLPLGPTIEKWDPVPLTTGISVDFELPWLIDCGHTVWNSSWISPEEVQQELFEVKVSVNPLADLAAFVLDTLHFLQTV